MADQSTPQPERQPEVPLEPPASPPTKSGVPRWVIAVSVLVIGIMLLFACGFGALVLVGFNAGKADAQQSACFSNERNSEMAAETYYVEEQRPAVDMDALVSAGYLDELPVCPADGTYTLDTERKVRCSVHGHYSTDQ